MSSEVALILKAETDKPRESVQRKALLELRDTPHNIEKGLRALKALLKAESDLIAPLENEEWLLMFLRSCKFYPESARDRIKYYYKIRSKYSEVKRLLVPSKLKHVFDNNLVSILPQRDQHGRRIILTMSGIHWNHKEISIDELFSASILCSDFLFKEPETQINGAVYILDLTSFSLGQAVQYTPYILKRFLDFTQDKSFLRVKGFHIVNQPRIFQPIYATLNRFLVAKFAQRFILHGKNYESLHRHISPTCLPACYGGSLNTKLMYGPETYQLLSQYEELFNNL